MTILDIKTFSNEELLKEIENRMMLNSGVKDTPPPLPAAPLHPYELMQRMINQGKVWSENPRKGKSNPNINKIWDYVGKPNYTDDQSYCAATMNALLNLCGYEMSDNIPVARSFETYGKRIKFSEVQPGDIVVWKRKGSSWAGHVAFFVETDGNEHIIAAGANQNDKMCRKKYPISGSSMEITEFRRIHEMNKVNTVDYDTIKEWGLS